MSLSIIRRLGLFMFAMMSCSASAEEVVVDFEATEVGKPLAVYSERGVSFELAHAPKKSKAKGRVMFFPHLGDEHKGILNAMADEAIPLRVKLPKPAAKATLKLWGSTTSAARVEAFDRNGELLAKDELKQVPVRQSPEQPVPYFTLSLEGSGIVAIEVSGAQPGGFVAIDELRIVYEETDESVAKSAP